MYTLHVFYYFSLSKTHIHSLPHFPLFLSIYSFLSLFLSLSLSIYIYIYMSDAPKVKCEYLFITVKIEYYSYVIGITLRLLSRLILMSDEHINSLLEEHSVRSDISKLLRKPTR